MSGEPFLTVRQQILSAAVELFAERGPDAVSLRQLAARIGLHNSTLFHYFPDKATLAASALDAVAQRQLEWLERLEADDPPRLDTLRTALDAWNRHLDGAPAEARLLIGALAGPGPPTTASPPLLRMVEHLEGWLGRAHEAGVVDCPAPAVGARFLLAIVLFRPRGVPAEASPAGERMRLALAALSSSATR